MIKNITIVYGGLRLGDCLHIIPRLNELRAVYPTAKIAWLSGTYEKAAVDFLCKIYDITPVYFKDAFPQNIDDRIKFCKEHPAQNRPDTLVISDPKWGFDINNTNFSYLPDSLIKELKPKHNKDYVVVHCSSVSNWKNSTDLFQYKYPYDVICVGKKDERLIPHSIDYRECDFMTLASLMYYSKYFIGIHSAMACFAFYIPNTKGLIHHFMPNIPIQFGQFRKDWVDIDKTKLIETLNNYLYEKK